MCKLLGSEVGVVDVPAELLFISLAVQLQVEVDGNQNLFWVFTHMFFEDIGGKRGEDELFIDCFVEGGVPGSSRV